MIKRLLQLAIVVVILIAGYEWMTFPDVSVLAKQMPNTTAFMDERRAELRSEGKDDTLSYRPVPYNLISPYLRRGVLVAEDNDFYEHGGVDVNAMKAALRRDLERRKMTSGGSTITQQLAKNLYLSSSRNPLRKVEEYFIAQSLENHLTKKRILEIYLNVVEMGERVYGAEAAARYYFHVPASALSPQQAALLAGCLPNPRVMVPGSPNKRLRARQRMILARMRRWGYVAEEEVLTAKKPEAAAAPAPTDTTPLEQTPPTDTATPPPADTSSGGGQPPSAVPPPPTDSAAPPSSTGTIKTNT